ncbi:hypothetical protein F4861DRAFT_454099 [Xylaria intraflava]|nr:hypothetical protein F4861DRAFT_454099 [Xylaria intraflava]
MTITVSPEDFADHRRFDRDAVAIKLACRLCLVRALEQFDPLNGEPLDIICAFTGENGSSCRDCSRNGDRCEPIPMMLKFDVKRLQILLNWSANLFDPQYTADRRSILMDKNDKIHYLAAYDTRLGLANAQIGLLRAFCDLVTTHRIEYDLTSHKKKHAIRYKKLVQQRMSVALRQPPPEDDCFPGDLDEYAATPGVRPLDMGHAAWSVAVRRFLDEVEASIPAGHKPCIWETLSNSFLCFE